MVSTLRRTLPLRYLLGLGLVFACAPSPPPAAPSERVTDSRERAEAEAGLAVLEGAPAQEEAAPAPAEEPAAPAASPGGSDDGLDADIAALSESTKPVGEAQATPATTEPVGREVVYRVTAKGLVIEIDGIHLRPEAKPFKYESGAYGIDLVLNAESFDGRQYWVNQPKEGPLSIAGKVEIKGGKSSRFVDEREGGAEQAVMNGEPRRFKQRWPGRGQPKLWSGQTVTLEVGLWGIRADSERERPVRRLFVVKMVAGNKSPAVITPPTMDWGT
jgi:hypothetical protein